MRFNLRRMLILTALIAGCFAAEPTIGVGTGVALSLMCFAMFFRLGLLAIFFWYLGFLMLADGNQTGAWAWFGLSSLIAIWPWLERLAVWDGRRLVEHDRGVNRNDF